MDAGGDGNYESINTFDKDGNFHRVQSGHDAILGPLYTYVTLALGMRPFEHEYKVMGLAPYAKGPAKQRTYEFFKQCVELDGIQFRRNTSIPDLY
mgnify:CR=1 FL=1|tara:strand:- start:141 stop:425 length:285 start_codon:yes stop_codon:yes gene_type:complete